MADMYKNQLQELAQRSCFNLPSYACIREGPDHAPRFKASVNFNGEIFESHTYCSTLRQAEHSAAEVALNALSTRGPSRSLTARVLDETGVYKNLLQETAHRAGLNLPVYTTVRSGPGHVPVFTCTVELAGMNFTGESAKTKKQAEKNAAIAAWSALKKMPNLGPLTQMSKETDSRQEQDHAIAARVLSNFRPKDEIKSIRRRDQNQGKRRMVKGYRDHLSSRSLKYQQWRPMDLLMDSIPESPTQKQNCFISLLPPPPPRTASRILPPSSSRESTPSLYPSTIRPTPAQVMGKKQDKWQEVPPPHDEHQRDENEWLHGKSEVMKKPIEKECPRNSTSTIVYGAKSIYGPFALPNTGKHNSLVPDHTTQNEETHLRTRLLRSLTPSPRAISPVKTSRCCHMSRTIYSGGHLPHRIAPAVQIRSVIPVCAAPPLPMRPSASMREVSSSSATSMPKIKGGEVSPEFNKLQPYPTQLINSEFNNKLQL